jgi:myosin heavy chain 9/10/11/14
LIREALKSRSDTFEQDARQAREQLAELTRTATDYSDMIKQREDEIARLMKDVDALKAERNHLSKEILELKGRIETLTTELSSLRSSEERNIALQTRLQDELDELRQLLETKVSEETARGEVEKRKEEELVGLRGQVNSLQQELDDARIAATDAQTKLKIELDSNAREYKLLVQSHRSLSDKLQANESKLKSAEASLAEVEKTKRSLESDLQSLRSKQIDIDGQLAETEKAKEVRVISIH